MHHFPGREQHALEAGAKRSAAAALSSIAARLSEWPIIMHRCAAYFRFQLIPYPRNKAARPLAVSGNDSNRDAVECLETG
jgi:hypothetical protein